MVRSRHTSLVVTAALVGAAALFVRASRPAPARRTRRDAKARHHVVIVGAGFGGLQAAQGLKYARGVRVTLLDEHNHHLFQPLLYQVATGALGPDEIASPVRAIVAREPRIDVLMAKVTGIDPMRKQVQCGSETVSYDTLVLATGSQPSYFGHDAWRHTALPLKTLDDALALRAKILGAFEAAAAAGDEERARALTFLLVGGGATGVEMAGSIAELAHEMLGEEFHSIPGLRARIILVEAGPNLLSGFAPDSIARATEDLRRMGVEVRLNTRVTDVRPGHVTLGEETVAAGTVIWTAGVEATQVAEWLGVQPAKRGKVAVGPDLQIPGLPGVFVIGDAALLTGSKALPELAPVAKQQGSFVARTIRRRVRGRSQMPPFHYVDYGQLAAIGRGDAIAEFGAVHLAGFPGWLAWAGAHIFFLIGFRNRFLVSAQWAFAYATKRRGGRVITTAAGAPGGQQPDPA